MSRTSFWAATIAIATLFSLSASAKDKRPLEWQSGKLVAQEITLEADEHGPLHRTHYTIETSSKVYIANRHGDRLDIVVNAPIKFAVDGNTLYIMDAKGKAHDCHLEQEALKPQ